MKRVFSTLAFSTMIALGFTATASSANAGIFGTASATAVAVETIGTSNRNLFNVSQRWHTRTRTSVHVEVDTAPAYIIQQRVYTPQYVVPRAPVRVFELPAAHIDWCYSWYRSYRSYDNTFQPYHGPRRACTSPYWN